jgi:hypothetical protein
MTVLGSAEGDKSLSFRTVVILVAAILLLHLTLVALAKRYDALFPIEDGFVTVRTYALGKTFLYDIARINTYK